jgi:RimJ/RimL family protein N-acetyltransferase
MDEPILTERLRLRPFTHADLDALHAIWSDPAVGPWVGGAHEHLQESVEELQGDLDHQARHGFGMWAVQERATGRVVGELGLQLFEQHGPDVEAGWCLAREVWGRGYATEAMRPWLEAGFARLGLPRIIAVMRPDNARSRRVCERLGFTEAGPRRAYGADLVQYVSERPRQPPERSARAPA